MFAQAQTAMPRKAQEKTVSPKIAHEVELDELLTFKPETLQALYQGARVPDLASVSGDLRGRMLAWPMLNPMVRSAVRVLASSNLFPWRGKSFAPHSEHGEVVVGEGINRVGSDAFRLYRFETFVGRSRAGNFDAVQLNYDLPSNPFFIRAIKDEIRELRPGLYLGQAWLALSGKEHLVLYFALEDVRRARGDRKN
jgi:hypothetical protein